jgi:hypothetical protein
MDECPICGSQETEEIPRAFVGLKVYYPWGKQGGGYLRVADLHNLKEDKKDG